MPHSDNIPPAIPTRVLIIGASSGIGHAVAQIYIKQGATVGLAARRTDKLREIQAGHANVYIESVDIREKHATEHLDNLVAAMGGLDLLLIASGIGQMNPTLEAETELATTMTNVQGWTAIADWGFNLFARQGHGHLAAITSIASLRGLGPAPAYAASKAYQAHYLEALRQRALGLGLPICVTNLRPGFVHTPLLAHPEKFFWVMGVESTARAIVHTLRKRRAVATVTSRWRLMVPLMRIAPTRLIAYILYKKTH